MRPHRGARPPVRLVHLGLGAFFRAHQAWYTGAAPDAAEWGIAAFTGRSRALADDLEAQGGLYTLVTRGPDRDAMAVQTGRAGAAGPGPGRRRRPGQDDRVPAARAGVTVVFASSPGR